MTYLSIKLFNPLSIPLWTQAKPTVLYVDDLPMNLKLFEATFRNDYNIILTESRQGSIANP